MQRALRQRCAAKYTIALLVDTITLADLISLLYNYQQIQTESRREVVPKT
ncbi:hypothetical protein KFU94_16455 [Chloroflexi bacterium TSY]|nr:hypothetical protein [Chloroflexi bacterium TSY]